MVRAGIFGATGYTGHELVRLLTRHPQVELAFGTSRADAGTSLRGIYPRAPDVALIDPQQAPVGEMDVVFLCLPHTQSAEIAVAALEAGARVVDLSADFRLRQERAYRRWYQLEHPAPDLLEEAVYGLTEVAQEALSSARLVANPGCYPTSALLGLYPLAKAGALSGPVFIDAKSGVSGAGRAPKPHTHFVEVADNLSPYSIGRRHRHLPEIEQELAGWAGGPLEVVFSPHLLPVPRGLLSTIYAPLVAGWDEARTRKAFAEIYRNAPFIELLGPEKPATLAHVTGTNLCSLGLSVVNGTALVTSAIDNLLKGAAGQAVQNMNWMFGFEEGEGLI